MEIKTNTCSVLLSTRPVLVSSVDKCYIGVEDTYANPRTLSFPDLSEVSFLDKIFSTLQIKIFSFFLPGLDSNDI